MTADEIQQVKFIFDAALQRFGFVADVQTVNAESVECELTVTFELWGRRFGGNFILSDQGLRTAGTPFFWLNAEIHVWQWIAMMLADTLDALVALAPVSPIQQS